MNVLVVGGGRIGSRLSEMLADDGHRVVVVEKEAAVCDVLRDRVSTRGVRVVCGDGDDPAVLIEAGIRDSQALAAVTSDDEDNLVIGLLGKREFSVPRIVGKINNPLNAWLFTRRMGIDAAVDPAMVIAKLLEEEAGVGEIVTLLKMRDGEASLVQLTLEDGWDAVGRALTTLTLPSQTAVVAIVRANDVLPPQPDVTLQAGDQVIALARPEAEEGLARIFRGTR